MDLTDDEIAGVVDLFGALTRAELREALSELAFKRGVEADGIDERIEDARESYHVLSVPRPGDAPDAFVVGPTAFPTPPDGAEDLPHIMDVPDRSVGDDRAASLARERFETDAERAIEDGDGDRIERLLDVSYELELWGSIEVAGLRERLTDARSSPNDS